MPETKIQTPIEIQMGVQSVIDHGCVLVHDIKGERRNYLHEVSIPANDDFARQVIHDRGYKFCIGWRKYQGAPLFHKYTREYPLSIETWQEGVAQQ